MKDEKCGGGRGGACYLHNMHDAASLLQLLRLRCHGGGGWGDEPAYFGKNSEAASAVRDSRLDAASIRAVGYLGI